VRPELQFENVEHGSGCDISNNVKSQNNLFSRWMFVMYFDLAQIDLLILMFSIKARIEVVDDEVVRLCPALVCQRSLLKQATV
jgi:hypothetical protein